MDTTEQAVWRSVIFGSLVPGTIDIHIAYGYGMNDGGGIRRLKREEVPEDCRIPNTYVWVTMVNGEIVNIQKMSAIEIKNNQRAI